MSHIIQTRFVLFFMICLSVTLFGQELTPLQIEPLHYGHATTYFPHRLESVWVYEDQDGNKLERRAVEDKEIKGKLYHAFGYEPELKDKMAYSPYIYPSLYHITDAGNIVLLCGDEVETSIKARLDKEVEFLTSEPEVAGPPVADLTIEVQGNDHLLFLPAKLFVDTPWEVNKIAAKIKGKDIEEGTFFSFSISITEIGRVLGTETIQTPAGPFDDCLKVEYKTQTKVSIIPKPPPGVVASPGETTTTLWLAPGIGVVKYHQVSWHILLNLIPATEFELVPVVSMVRTLKLKEADIKLK